MGAFSRVLLALYTFFLTLFFLAASLFTITGWEIPLNYLARAMLFPQQRLFIGITFFLFFLLGLYFFFLAMAGRKGGEPAIVHETDLGQVRVSLFTVENLIRRVAGQFRGLREIKPRVRLGPQGLSILIQAQVTPDTNIPQVSLELQHKVQEYINEVVGIKVENIKVSIENISADLRARVE